MKTLSPYAFTLELSSGKTLDLSNHSNQPLLVVNTATRCGLAPQFEGLEELHKEFGPQGLLVIGLPSNQFADQEPETDLNMSQTCKMNFGVTFPLTKKILVNGPNSNPFFETLKTLAPGLWGKTSISWNFTKFLVWPHSGKIKRFAPTTSPKKIRKDLLKMFSL